MTFNTPRVSALLAAFMALCLSMPAQAERPAKLKHKIDQLFAKWDVEGSPGASVAVIADGRTFYLKGYGYANLEHSVRNTPDTAIHVASLSKQFTGIAALMAEEKGLLKLDDPLGRYVTDGPSVAAAVTLRQLIYHTGGLRDLSSLLMIAGYSLEDVTTKDKVMTLIKRQRHLNFPPGTEHLYSNTGYVLFTDALEKITGETFAKWTDKEIFQPLGMRQTRFNDDYTTVIPNHAESYAATKEGAYRRSPMNLGIVGSTGLQTTARDMATWGQFVIKGAYRNLHMPKAFYQPGALGDGTPIAYGFGIFVNESRGRKVLEHGGSDSAFRSYFMAIPEKGVAVAVLANTDNLPAGELAKQIVDLILGEEPAAAAETESTAAPTFIDAKKYVGRYLMENGFTVEIAAATATDLYAASGASQLPLHPLGDDTFAVGSGEIKITFHPSADGQRFETVTVLTAGKTDLGRRMEEKSVPTALLDAIAGSYYSPEVDRYFDLVADNGMAKYISPGGQKLPLSYLEGDVFLNIDTGSKISFIRNKAGIIDRAVMTSLRVRNFELLKAPRPQD